MTEGRSLKSFWTLSAIWLAILIFFRLFPSVDIGFSRLFFSTSVCFPGGGSADCGVFPMGEIPAFVFLRTVFYYLPVVLAIALLASLLIPAIDRLFDWPEASRRNRMIALAAWILDAGLFVNLLLKEHSGRPRPADVSLFSGHLPFMPAGSLSGACVSNCSFISGEAASGGWLFCLLALVRPDMRRLIFWPVVAVSVATALLRVFFGRHFLSDAVLAWLSAIVFFELLAALFGWNESASDDALSVDSQK